MDFFTNLIATPRADHLLLNRFIIIGISALFLFYMSILFGSLFFSLLFNSRGRSENDPVSLKFSKDLMATFLSWKVVGVILGILPVLVLLITFSQNLYGTSIHIARYFLYILILATVAYIFAVLYKNSLLKEEGNYQLQQLLGTVSVLSIVLLIYIFISTTSLILFPSRWTLIKWPLPVFFDFNIVVRFLIFFTAAFAVTGSAILFFFFNWGGGKTNLDEEYENFVLKFSGGVSLAAVIGLGLLLLWDFKTFPEVALGGAYRFSLFGFPVIIDNFMIALAIVFMLLVVSLMLYSLLSKFDVSKGTQIFILFIVIIIGLSANDNLAQDTALTEHYLYLQKLTGELERKLEMQREELAAPGEVSSAVGENIFNTRCFACHKFDQRLVGPPYKETLPKYENDMDALVKFILNPVKKNPDYPIMPNQGLTPAEAKAVAKYIMETYLSDYK